MRSGFMRRQRGFYRYNARDVIADREGEMSTEYRIDKALAEKYKALPPNMRELLDKIIVLLMEQHSYEKIKQKQP